MDISFAVAESIAAQTGDFDISIFAEITKSEQSLLVLILTNKNTQTLQLGL